MQLLGRQPQIGDTINDQIAKHITINSNGINVDVSPLVTNHYGTLSKAVLWALSKKRLDMRWENTKR